MRNIITYKSLIDGDYFFQLSTWHFNKSLIIKLKGVQVLFADNIAAVFLIKNGF